MPRVADYSIVADGGVVEFTQDTITFEVPANIDAGSRSILGFMVKVWSADETSLTLRINGTKVWTWGSSGGSDYPKRMPYIQSFDDGDPSVGEAVGFDQLRLQLIQIAGMYSEGVGMLFGSGSTGWHEI